MISPAVVVKTTHLALRFPRRRVIFYEIVMLTSIFGRLISIVTYIPLVEAISQIPLQVAFQALAVLTQRHRVKAA